MTAYTRLDPPLVESIRKALTGNALPGETQGVSRDADGEWRALEDYCGDKSRRESMMYLELDRADARGRQELAADLRRVLDDVRLAVRDWESLQRQMREDAAAISDPEGAALLNWFADGAMTLLGYHVEKPYEQPSCSLGIFSIPGAPTDEGGAFGAMRYLEKNA